MMKKLLAIAALAVGFMSMSPVEAVYAVIHPGSADIQVVRPLPYGGSLNYILTTKSNLPGQSLFGTAFPVGNVDNNINVAPLSQASGSFKVVKVRVTANPNANQYPEGIMTLYLDPNKANPTSNEIEIR
jgi:hypothetical protein